MPPKKFRKLSSQPAPPPTKDAQVNAILQAIDRVKTHSEQLDQAQDRSAEDVDNAKEALRREFKILESAVHEFRDRPPPDSSRTNQMRPISLTDDQRYHVRRMKDAVAAARAGGEAEKDRLRNVAMEFGKAFGVKMAGVADDDDEYWLPSQRTVVTANGLAVDGEDSDDSSESDFEAPEIPGLIDLEAQRARLSGTKPRASRPKGHDSPQKSPAPTQPEDDKGDEAKDGSDGSKEEMKNQA